ncbi:MAG: hypothetical protein E6J90_08805 [Deltaproteobacteria bacterium]|nr:MAG: hypothetical protein E6J90_08805 [Deltaproteobacteria bacterium]
MANRTNYPKHQPTPEQRKQVEAMAAYGLPHEDITRVIGIALPTLYKWYREELDTGHVKANARVADNLFKIATGSGREAVTAAIFWLKVRAGWSEYAPPVQLGKKAQAELEAVKSADGTEWHTLVH